MKKVLFSLFLFSVMAVGVQAQKSASVATTGGSDAAAKLASMDSSIETKTCPVTGTVSYVRKETCAGSGTVSYVDVNYDAATNTFVNVSPMKMEGGKDSATSTSGSNGKSCCAGKTTATTTSTTTSGKAVKTSSSSKD